jgi:TatD DNase family protein
MFFHDTHSHLDLLLEKLEILQNLDRNTSLDLEKLEINENQIREKIDELLANHEFVIHPTVSSENYLLIQKLFQKFPQIYYLLGSHPEIVNEDFMVSNYLQKQQKIVNSKDFLVNLKQHKLVGIGECGLDYFYSQKPEIINKQTELFLAQIQLAIDLNLPLIVHTRDAFADTIEIIKKFPKIHGKFLIHCFTGGREIVKEILDLGGFMAFGGILTFKKAEYLRESLTYCPDNSWVLETDLPFLSPNRGQICLPKDINLIAETAATVKNLELSEIWQISRNNSLRLFDLGESF